MKSRRLVTSRKLAAYGLKGCVLVSHDSLAASRTRTPPAKTPAQAAPIQSQVHNIWLSTIAPSHPARLRPGCRRAGRWGSGPSFAARPAGSWSRRDARNDRACEPTPHGELMVTVLAGLATFERHLIR